MCGDPHVETVDNPLSHFFEEGEFWVVNSPLVYTQDHSLATLLTECFAATNIIAVGGLAMQGHTGDAIAVDSCGIKVSANDGLEHADLMWEGLRLRGAAKPSKVAKV